MIDTLEQTLKLVHPLMPFVTEEIWKQFKIYFDQKDESLMLCSFPEINSFETDKSYHAVEWLKRVVSGIRICNVNKINYTLLWVHITYFLYINLDYKRRMRKGTVPLTLKWRTRCAASG